MKDLWRTLLILGVFGTCAVGAAAQANLVVISNTSGEKRKICVYDANDDVRVIAKKCFELNASEKMTWNRQYDRTSFKVNIYKPGLLDEYLYTRTLPGDTSRIIVADGERFGFGRGEAKPTAVRFKLKVCNQQYDEKVYFVLGFETNKGRFTEGWWNVGKGQCLEFPVSESLKRKIGLDYGNLPRTFYFARTYGSDPLFWRGSDDRYQLCINESEAFSRHTKLNSNGSYDTLFDGSGYRNFSFRRMDDPKTNEEWYYLTF